MDLAGFVKWAVNESSFAGCDLDGGSVQEEAVRCGILIETIYDPEIHGAETDCEPGDAYYVFSEEFKTALAIRGEF